ncbi:MAG: ISAs1 family transposase [Chloroflexota bacterium]|nr:ISAs1 family transposase [Chloroflexota bacterium]
MVQAAGPVPALLPYLDAVPDPRKPRGKRHPLSAILGLSCAAMLAGCDSLLALTEWGRDPAGGAPLAARLGFTRAKTPCVATLHRVFKTIDVAAFERAVGAWATATEAARANDAPGGPIPLRAVAVDGKVLRGSAAAGVPAVRLLSALGHDLGLVLAESPVAPTTDEAGALPALLAALVVEGRVLTFDAAFTDRTVAEAISEKGGTP